MRQEPHPDDDASAQHGDACEVRAGSEGPRKDDRDWLEGDVSREEDQAHDRLCVSVG